jgi:hypothetical protein
MTGDYNGSQVIDVNADEVGTVEESYEDSEGTIRFVKVKIGSLFAKHRLVPTEEVETTGNGIQVPYSKDAIDNSPDASAAGEMLDGDLLEEAQAYYAAGPKIAHVIDDSSVGDEPDAASVLPGQNQPEVAVVPSDQNQAADVQLGEIRDAGDVIEIPIIEEQLVKRRVVKEVLRVRKRDVGEQQTVSAQVRKEDIEIDNGDNAPINVSDAVDSPGARGQ